MPKSNQSSAIASSLSEIGGKITHYIQAGYPGLYIVSAEEQRVEAELKAVTQHLAALNEQKRLSNPAAEFQPHTLSFWSVVDGLVNLNTSQVIEANDPLEALQAISQQKGPAIFLLKDFHLSLQDPNPVLLRKFKDVLLDGKANSKTVIILGCRLILVPELEHELSVIEFALPGKSELTHVLNGITTSANLETIEGEQRDRLIDAASGLTTMEAENAFALSFVRTKTIEPEVVAREKASAVKKNGLLEIVETAESLDSIGGLDVLKDWLLKRKNAFSQKAVQFGLPTPKGLLILGLAGTGKSLTAKATAKVFNVPLLKLDAGKIFASLVGQSESNLRSVIQTAEAISPCCLWIDELEKGFSGSKSSGSTDGGTSARVFGSFLSWMQEKKSSVFVVATTNDVSQLPPELLRKGRWDELFFVDLPNEKEREAIWNIQIRKYGRVAEDYDVVQLAKITEGFTGSEIEAVFVDALFLAFDAEQEPTDLTVATVLNDFVPLSRLMAEQIQGLRSWSKGRARLATSVVQEKRMRKMV